MTCSTRTGRRDAMGGGVLQWVRVSLAGSGPGWLAHWGDPAVAGRETWMERNVRWCGALAVSQPTRFWNVPSRPVGENDAIPIEPPQQAVLNTDEAVAKNANSGGCVFTHLLLRFT